MSLSNLLGRAHAALAHRFTDAATAPNLLFFSFTDGTARSHIVRAAGASFAQAWKDGATRCQAEARRLKLAARWLRVDWPVETQATTWAELAERLKRTKRNYFRMGLALDAELRHAFLEPELNANAMLYLGADKAEAGVNPKNFTVRAQRRFGKTFEPDFSPDAAVYVFTHEGLFVSDDPAINALPDGSEPNWLPATATRLGWRNPASLNAGLRQIPALSAGQVYALIESSANFLARQVKKSGQFVYGHFPCFGRLIPTYNSLRHASSVYSMLEAWELTRDDALLAAIRRGLTCLADTLIRRYPQPDGTHLAYNVDVNGEIKLGANAVSLLALVKYDELTHDTRYRGLMEELALGIARMQDANTGKLVHVLNSDDLSVKEAFRIVYYDGEAAFGLMRLYGLTRDPRWLAIVEKAFDYFIANDHWKHHDHWLSYCANELTLYKPEEKYFRFGVQNIAGYLDFILTRETTYPTLLELSMAFEAMLRRINTDHPEMRHVLDDLDIEKFHRALHHRAHYLLNGFFWPELAMYYAKPQSVVGSFFIRHHSFRVRIDDIEHYLSGYVAYWKMLTGTGPYASGAKNSGHTAPESRPDTSNNGSRERAVIAWGGDVNLGRRQHYRTSELGAGNVLNIPALKEADLSIVNLECVVATQGEQGVRKGEGGPYYYRARPEMLKVLLEAGVDVVATANNHSGDYGPQALLEQRLWLDATGIAHAGTGTDRESAFAATVRRAKNLNVAVFSVDATQHRFAAAAGTPGGAYLPLENANDWYAEFAPRIAAVRAQAHLVFVAVHWGANFAPEPSAAQRAAAHALVEAGADAVLGASAHVVQGIEIHKNRPIIYDAGDLLFDSIRREPRKSGVFRLECDHTGVTSLTFTPVAVGFAQTAQLKGDDARAASERFSQRCAVLGTAVSVNQAGQACITLSPPARDRITPVPAPRVRPDPHVAALAHDFLAAHAKRHTVDTVPDDARIEPCDIGPLTLLGFRVTPQTITHRRMLWVETFWQCHAPMQDDLRIDIRAVPMRESTMPAWGQAMDHDPCDWMMPTSRWVPGVIYRDYYGLRPPYLKDLQNVDLHVTIRLVSGRGTSAPLTLPITVKLAIPGKNTVANKETSAAMAPVYRTTFPDVIYDSKPGQTWTATQLAAITQGRWVVEPPEGWYAKSVIAGAKHIGMVPGPTLFVAHTESDRHRHEQRSRPAKSFNRHSLLPSRAGQLAGAIVSEEHIAQHLPRNFPLLLVSDPIQCLIELGLAARQRYHGDVVAVTGTVGKSTTTSLIQTLLGGPARVLASSDNYNSRVGAPATLASLSPDYEAAVIEVAQSALWMKRGPVTRLLRPSVALITEIGMSQTDARVKSIEDAARWKARIFDGLCDAAVAIVGEHLPCLDYVLERARQHAKRVIVFGHSPQADIRILEVHMDEAGSWVRLALPTGSVRLRVPVPGSGMVNNTVAAIAVLHALGRDIPSAVEALARFELDEGRMQHHDLQLKGARVQVIDDSFNAEVVSMAHALSVFGAARKRSPKRRIAVLGRIVHLGELAKPLHASLAQPVLASGADLVITHGDEMRYLREVLPETLLGPHFSDAPALVEYLMKVLKDGDLVLLKGSRRDSDFGSVFSLLAQYSTSHGPGSSTHTATGTHGTSV